MVLLSSVDVVVVVGTGGSLLLYKICCLTAAVSAFPVIVVVVVVVVVVVAECYVHFKPLRFERFRPQESAQLYLDTLSVWPGRTREAS